MLKRYFFFFPTLLLLFPACAVKSAFDASGTFESIEVLVSAEANGKIMKFMVQEGQHLDSGQYIGYIDTMQLYLHKRQMLANAKAILITKPDLGKETASIEQQITNAEIEKKRTANLVNDRAVPAKELDDINEQINVLQRQLAAQKSTLNTNTNSIAAQSKPVYYQADQLEDEMQKSRIINPISGTVLTKYVEPGEITASGKPFYRIADLSVLILRAYISNGQLSQVKIGQMVKVFVDNGNKTYKEMNGKITWVSDEAEFTPKTIETKEERANLVYAMKIEVVNDGFLKIGMYGEVKFK